MEAPSLQEYSWAALFKGKSLKEALSLARTMPVSISDSMDFIRSLMSSTLGSDQTAIFIGSHQNYTTARWRSHLEILCDPQLYIKDTRGTAIRTVICFTDSVGDKFLQCDYYGESPNTTLLAGALTVVLKKHHSYTKFRMTEEHLHQACMKILSSYYHTLPPSDERVVYENIPEIDIMIHQDSYTETIDHQWWVFDSASGKFKILGSLPVTNESILFNTIGHHYCRCIRDTKCTVIKADVLGDEGVYRQVLLKNVCNVESVGLAIETVCHEVFLCFGPIVTFENLSYTDLGSRYSSSGKLGQPIKSSIDAMHKTTSEFNKRIIFTAQNLRGKTTHIQVSVFLW